MGTGHRAADIGYPLPDACLPVLAARYQSEPWPIRGSA
jgi:hypothetical protein